MLMRLCGIDEAGRGPLAGDLVMAGCILLSEIDGLNDSKKLTEKQREKLFVEIIEKSTYHIVRFSASDIDSFGIATCLKNGLLEIKQTLHAMSYLFDGNTNYGVEAIETMIQADGKIAEVSAASILAKVTHDREILELAKHYPQYELEKHKGYGTKRHIELIKQYGLSDIHRKTYKIKALEATLF